MKYLLHSHITGKGEPIVLLHGYLASSHYFKWVQKRLEKDYRIIALDLLGFGRSPKPGSYGYPEQLEAIRATLRHLGISLPVTLVGHSMGALIALRYANAFPNDISKLMLFNPPMYASTKQAVTTFKKSGRHYQMLLYSPLRDRYWAALKTLPRSISRRRQPLNLTDIVRASPGARRGSYENIILKAAFFPDLETAGHKTLLVVGKYDRHVYQENLGTRTLPSNVTLKIVETGHHTLVRNPALGEELIRSHLLQ